MIRINLAPLETGLHDFVLEPAAVELGLEPDRFKDIVVRVRLDRSVDRVLVMLGVQATATLECDRTLVLFDKVLEGNYTVLFGPRELVEGDEEEIDDDFKVLLPSDTEIDLTESIRDTILLAIPARCVAPGAEEAEIPMRFGPGAPGEEPIDPRWEALRRLKDADDV